MSVNTIMGLAANLPGGWEGNCGALTLFQQTLSIAVFSYISEASSGSCSSFSIQQSFSNCIYAGLKPILVYFIGRVGSYLIVMCTAVIFAFFISFHICHSGYFVISVIILLC